MSKPNEWSEFRSRLLSGLILLFVSGTCIYVGGLFFTFYNNACWSYYWELGKMLSPISAQAMWFSAVLSIIVSFYILGSQSFWAFINFIYQFLPPEILFHHSRNFGAVYSVAVIICGMVFYNVHNFSLFHTVWLIGIVVVTDTAGYIIGRIVGGLKFFPA